jgi:hypothetical protein
VLEDGDDRFLRNIINVVNVSNTAYIIRFEMLVTTYKKTTSTWRHNPKHQERVDIGDVMRDEP